MLAAIADGISTIHNYSEGADCQSTLGTLRDLGVKIERLPDATLIHGAGLDGLRPPARMLDAGNSGSTIRMLTGILAAQPFGSSIGGDESLSRRPMRRIMVPLAEMGAHIEARDGQFPPLTIQGSELYPIEYTLPVASAQVKTCVLFAGLFATGITSVVEAIRPRDHTELALLEFGVEIAIRRGAMSVAGRQRLSPCEITVPGDISAASFLLTAALIVPDSDLVIRGVGLNPTRSSLLDLLASMGAQIKVLDIQQMGGEVVGDLRIQYSPIRGGTVSGEMTAALIDEIPTLAVLGAVSEEGLTVRDAAELRVKETDRIGTIAENMRRMGIGIEVHPDGFSIPGRQKFHAARLDSFGDHRIAMAFAVAALIADNECWIDNSESASVSFPGFYQLLRGLAT